MRICDIKVNELREYKMNNRKHDAEQVQRIAKSIAEFGFNQPLVVDGENCIVVGHGRFLAAKHAGIESVPCVVLADVSEEKIRAYRLLDNKLQNDSDWIKENVLSELAWLGGGEEIDFAAFGLDDFYDAMRGSAAENFLDDAVQKEEKMRLHCCPNCGHEF